MRGKDKNDDFGVQQIGITPAYAGKRFLLSVSFLLLTDHPRLCGEKDFIEVFGVSLMGSPPPMRGKGIKPLTVSDVQGITPAYAGKSCRNADR